MLLTRLRSIREVQNVRGAPEHLLDFVVSTQEMSALLGAQGVMSGRRWRKTDDRVRHAESERLID